MAAFVKDVMDSTQEQIDTDQARKEQDEFARMAKNLQKQYGGQQQAGTPSLGIGTPTGYSAASNQSAMDEFNRRKAAAGSAFDLGSKVDARRSALSDELNAALKRREQATAKFQTSQQHTDRENALAMAQIGQDAKSKMAQENFSMYKNQTDRNLAMVALYNKGALEGALRKAASENALKQQDINNYFDMLEAGLRADYDAAMKNQDWDWEQEQLKMERQANNFARIIEGVSIGGQAGATKYISNKRAEEGT